MAFTPKPPTPAPTAIPDLPSYIGNFTIREVAPWLIACTVIVCVLIIALVITVVVLCYKQNKGEIYAGEQANQKDDTVEIRSIYSVQKSSRPTTPRN